MARVIGDINGVQFEGTYDECVEWVANAEAEQEEYYPDADVYDLEFYTIEED
jgi:hypothetical protein